MAEARMAVAPHPALHRFGHEVDTSIRVPQLHVSKAGVVFYIPPPRNLFNLLRRKLWRAVAKVRCAFLPLPISFVFGITAGVAYWVVKSDRHSWQRSGALASWLWRMDNMNPLSRHIPTDYRVGYLASYTSAAVLLGFTAAQRFLLRKLLSYHDWLYERPPKISLKTKIWAVLLKNIFIRRTSSNLHAYEGALPNLPLPSIKDTVTRYLVTMEPLLTDKEMQELRHLADQFLKQEGPKLQWYLRLKHWMSKNYISDWWMDYVYLRGRDPIAINSNWFGVCFDEYQPTHNVAARAASCVYELLVYRRKLDSDTFEPQMINNTVPICMGQYEYIFNTTRVPGVEQDTLVKTDPSESRHIVVIYQGRFYRVQCYSTNTGRILRPLEFETVFRSILASHEETDPYEKLLPALTCIDRTRWAHIREQYFNADAVNRSALDVIEKAIFVMSLDDDAPEDRAEEGKSFLCGNGHNRWADKSFNMCIKANARMGCHVEHAWGDAPTFACILENIALTDEQRKHFAEDGSIKPTPADIKKQKEGTFKIYPAERLQFHMTQELKDHVVNANKEYTAAIDDLDLVILHFTDYGKNVAKKSKCSPDAWVQMSFQLAYWRQQHRFDQTYESSMTRLFREGRTETIRSASNESCAFVRAMDNPNVSNAERLRLLRAASNRHQRYSHDCMVGKGVDRHLFGLYVVSVGKGIPSPFLNSALGRKWKLSTSQVPTRQLPPKVHDPDVNKFRTSMGGFGPVADDGYGILYSIYGEDMFYFTITSKHSCKETSSRELADLIQQALRDMYNILEVE